LRALAICSPSSPEEVLAVVPSNRSAEDVCEILGGDGARLRSDLVGDLNQVGGSAGAYGCFVEVGPWFLKASLRRRYSGFQEALAAELASEQLRQRLGVYSEERIWFLSRGSDERFWACSLTPVLAILRGRLNREKGVEPWNLYLEAVGMTYAVARDWSLWLDCNPNNFGQAGERLFYVDDDLTRGGANVILQVLVRLREYSAVDLEIRLDFLERFADLTREAAASLSEVKGPVADLGNEILWPAEPELRRTLISLRRDLRTTRRSRR
jgi:hypothetical protein